MDIIIISKQERGLSTMVNNTEMRDTKRFEVMLDKLEHSIQRNDAAREAITSVNMMEQPIFVKAIVENIPNILESIQPQIADFRTHQKEMANLRKERNTQPAETTPKKRGRPPKNKTISQ